MGQQSPRIYLSPPHMSGREQDYLADVFASNWIAPAGPHLAQFEERFARRVGVRSAAAVTTGTAALHLLLRCLELQPGDEVICPTFTFCATANPIVYERACPVFIDSDRDSWNIDPNLLSEELAHGAACGRLPRAIVVADIYGRPADWKSILEIAARYAIPVIDDAAEALGATYRGAPVGSHARASAFSFNGNKIITTSGGGMVCSNDDQLVDRVRFLATQARDPVPHYRHTSIGFNYRMSNVLAAIGLAQLEVLDDRVARRRQIFGYYQKHLDGLRGVGTMGEVPWGESNCWLSVLLIDEPRFGASCEDVRIALEAENIESRRVWLPLHRQPSFAGCRCRGGSVADRLFATALCLPSGSALTEEDLGRVVRAVRAVGGR